MAELRTVGEMPLGNVSDVDEALVGSGPRMSELLSNLELASESDATVLVTGETGTGKNAVARCIHRASARSSRPFIHVDCASLAPSLVESELFGHERGAFTGALARHPGRFERAGNGTIFLDEIGELEPRLQAKLLRVLEEREFEALGGTRTRRMRARVVAATSRELENEVALGRFRADLFYRLHILRVHVPALRERKEDIPALAAEGARRAALRLRRTPPSLSVEFVQALHQHTWPGNVRELLNLVEAAIVRSPAHGPSSRSVVDLLARTPRFATCEGPREFDRTTPASPSMSATNADGTSARRLTRAPDRTRIAELLVATGGNVARVARKLGIPRSTLRYRIQRLGLEGLVPRE